MTSHERIDAAIAARPQATPGPLEVVFKGAIDKYTVEKQEGGVHRQLAYCGYSDASLFAAAPDLADEVIRLRKWQQETLPWLNVAAAQFKPRPLDLVTFNSTVGTIYRLIAEAQED